MEYRPSEAGVLARFEGPREIEAVATAFREHNAYLELIGNGSSVHSYHRLVAGWRGTAQDYRSESDGELVNKLQYLVDGVDERVDEILDTREEPERTQEVARRYRLAEDARILLESIAVQSAIAAEARELLEE